MCEKIPAFIIVEKWLEQAINPQVQNIGVITKQATNYGSTGIEISLIPNLAKKIKVSAETDLTVAELEDSFVAKMLEHPLHKAFIESFSVLPAPLSEEEIETLEKENPAKGENLCPTYEYKKYKESQFLIKYLPFDIEFSTDIFQSPEVVTKYLFYKAKMLEIELVFQNGEFEKNNKYFTEQYFWFLLDILFKSANFKEKTK